MGIIWMIYYTLSKINDWNRDNKQKLHHFDATSTHPVLFCLPVLPEWRPASPAGWPPLPVSAAPECLLAGASLWTPASRLSSPGWFLTMETTKRTAAFNTDVSVLWQVSNDAGCGQASARRSGGHGVTPDHSFVILSQSLGWCPVRHFNSIDNTPLWQK